MEAYAYSKGWAGILNGTITAESFGNKSEFPKVARGSLSGLTYEKFYPEKVLDDYDEFDLLEDSNKFQEKIEIENSSEEIHDDTKVLHEKAEKVFKVEKAEKVAKVAKEIRGLTLEKFETGNKALYFKLISSISQTMLYQFIGHTCGDTYGIWGKLFDQHESHAVFNFKILMNKILTIQPSKDQPMENFIAEILDNNRKLHIIVKEQRIDVLDHN
jgi:hypothetical protein